MAIRRYHYDAAFEDYLRSEQIPHVVVDEQRRALMREASLKSMDFIVYSNTGVNLLVDVKGRRFPSGGTSGSHRWENWATDDDPRQFAEMGICIWCRLSCLAHLCL